MGERVTCPFCGLSCDDLLVSDADVDTRGCALAAAGFARAALSRKPHTVAGKPASLQTAVIATADLLRGTTRPLFHGLAADLSAIRAVLALAECVGGTFDHMYSNALLANASVARASGWVTATFSEVANRADFILLVGSDPQRNFPRFYERLARNPTPLYREAPPTLAYIGPRSLAPPESLVPLRAIVDDTALLVGVGALCLLLHHRRPPDACLPVAALAEIAGCLAGARYGVLAWELSAYAPATAELIVEYLADTLRHLNSRTRCVGLPLGGNGNAVGAMQASLWQTGWPLRVSFADAGPSHDPWRFDGNRIIDTGEADAVFWVSALAAESPPANAAPLIALVSDDVQLSVPAAIEIRVGVPGIDHGGEIVRADTVIALPLQAARPSDRPSVAEVARAILEVLEEAPC